MILKDVAEFLVDTGHRTARAEHDHSSVEVNGRHFIESRAWEEVQPPDRASHLEQGTFLDLASLVAWANQASAEGPPTGEIRISRTGRSEAITPRWAKSWERREVVRKPFFRAFLPYPEGAIHEQDQVALSYPAILSWLELLGEGLRDRNEIELAFRTLDAVDAESKVKAVATGPVISVEIRKSSGDIKQGGKLPRVIRAEIPFGDPDFKTEVHFGLQVQVSKGEFQFVLRHLPGDGALDAYLEWAAGEAKAALSDGWLVVKVP